MLFLYKMILNLNKKKNLQKLLKTSKMRSIKKNMILQSSKYKIKPKPFREIASHEFFDMVIK